MKHVLGYDDALDVFGTHGMGGFMGNILTGIFAQQWVARLDGQEIPGGWVDGNWIQVPLQLCGSVVGAAWSFFWTFLIVFVMDKLPFVHLRMKESDQEIGVDLAEMGEVAYTIPDIVKAAGRRISNVFVGPTELDRLGAKQYKPGRHPSYPGIQHKAGGALKKFQKGHKISEVDEEAGEENEENDRKESHENNQGPALTSRESEYSLEAH